jgi:hypothetical protein
VSVLIAVFTSVTTFKSPHCHKSKQFSADRLNFINANRSRTINCSGALNVGESISCFQAEPLLKAEQGGTRGWVDIVKENERVSGDG